MNQSYEEIISHLNLDDDDDVVEISSKCDRKALDEQERLNLVKALQKAKKKFDKACKNIVELRKNINSQSKLWQNINDSDDVDNCNREVHKRKLMNEIETMENIKEILVIFAKRKISDIERIQVEIYGEEAASTAQNLS